MVIFIKLFFESFRFAYSALRENLLRTFLSLLGVTIGIFTIIAVFTLVDTLNASILNSLSFLGEKVIYVQKWPFVGDKPWWYYIKRPQVNLDEFKFIEKNATQASAVSIFDQKTGITVKYKNNSISSVAALGVSYNHSKISDLKIAEGRYFSRQEAGSSGNVVLIGHTIAQELFPNLNPLGKEVKIKGIKFKIIGLLEKQGETFLPGAPTNDELCLIPYLSMAKLYASRKKGLSPIIAVKGYENDEKLQELEGELTGLMRAKRRLKPKEEDNFALNRPEAIAALINTVTQSLTIAAGIIASFSILVGGFGIANIMFVSVKERTNLIGIQKSLGAKNYFILLQFLLEAMFLSLLGGMMGLVLVSLLTFLSTDTFEITLTLSNVMIGLVISSCVGGLSGIVPAFIASRLDPVIAIRSK